jgi:hypothetical protein
VSEKWIHNPDGSIFASDGTIVAWARVDAECGRKGDYYECHRFQARAKLKIDPRRLNLILAAPQLLEALVLLLNDVGRASSLPGAVLARAAISRATGAEAGE